MPAEIIATSNSKPASCPIGRWIQRLTRRWRARSDIAAGCRKGCWGSRWGRGVLPNGNRTSIGFPDRALRGGADRQRQPAPQGRSRDDGRSEEHTSELQSLMRSSYAVFCLKKKNPETNA